MNVPHHAHDLEGHEFAEIHEHLAADGVLVREQLLGERLADDCDEWRTLHVCHFDSTSGQEPDAHGLEIARHHDPEGGPPPIGRVQRRGLRRVTCEPVAGIADR